MPDIEKDVAAGEGADKGTGAGEGQDSATDDKSKGVATDTGKEDAGKGEGTEGGEGADQKDTSKGQEGQEKSAKAPDGKDTSKEGEDDGSEPATRKRLSISDYVAGRKLKKLSKTAKADEGTADEGTDEDEEDEEVAQKDKDLIAKVVTPMLAPFVDKSLKAEDDQEVAAFLVENPDFKPFEAKARRYMQHPSRRQLPVKSIFYEVAGDKLIKIGADRAKAADEKAKNTQTGGGSNRAGEGAKNDWALPKDEFEAKQERIRRGEKS